MTCASVLPSPGTAFLRVFDSLHLGQTMTSEAIVANSSFLDKISPFELNSELLLKQQ
jgi:hypothetical protein